MIWLLFTLPLNVFANTVLIQAPQTVGYEYKAMLKARSNLVSPSQDYLNSHPSLALREQLLNFFTDAQRAFLEQSNEEAQAKFTAILTLLVQDDWEKSDREVFFQAYLRLAQMESDGSKRDKWLGESLLLGDVKYDSNLFPPPLIARRLELAQKLPKKDVSKKLLGAGWTQVLVNGQSCGKGECASFPVYPGQSRVTVLSDQWLPQTTTLELADIDHLNPTVMVWAEGNCENSHLAQEANRFPDKKVFWGLNCERAESALSLKPTIPQPQPLFTTSAPKSAPIWESKWFWGGVVAAVAIIVVTNSQKKETKEPTTTYGFK